MSVLLLSDFKRWAAIETDADDDNAQLALDTAEEDLAAQTGQAMEDLALLAKARIAIYSQAAELYRHRESDSATERKPTRTYTALVNSLKVIPE